jgi:soluble lytic murein transglycosylase
MARDARALRVALRDTLGGEALARELLEGAAAQAPASGQALELLTRLASVRGMAFPLALSRHAAQAEWANGQRAEALARLRQVAFAAPPDERGVDELQRVRWWREWRKPRTAIGACDTAARYVREPRERDALRLERARAQRDAGLSDSALIGYRRVARTAEDARVRMTAWWEAAREAQDRSRWREAATAFLAADSVARDVREGRELVRDAGTLAGLMRWLEGDEAAAVREWRTRRDRRARFWLGVALRHQGSPRATRSCASSSPSVPASICCRRPRATRSVCRAGRVACSRPRPTRSNRSSGMRSCACRANYMLPDAASRLVSARDRADVRLPRGPQRMFAAASWRAVAVAAYASGDLAAATRAADRALLAPVPDSVAWQWVPWAFPPAFAPELARAAGRAGVEPALLWALVRQESRFDPRAVSRSRALGLAQLLPGTAGDMARELRESLPNDTLMFEPDRALRYGARYLRKLLNRFDGVVPVALTAYNAGPGKVRADWRELLARGGWALYCELAANADTQDYVRRILGYRQAYRELAPAIAP